MDLKNKHRKNWAFTLVEVLPPVGVAALLVRGQLDNPDPRLAADIKKLNLNPAQYKTINGRPARYIDPDFLWW